MICSFVPHFLSQTTFVAAQVKGFAPPKSDALAACFSRPSFAEAKQRGAGEGIPPSILRIDPHLMMIREAPLRLGQDKNKPVEI